MNKKILVVDDSKLARLKIIDFIKNLEFQVIHEAEDGLIALERFKKIDYDYVIMDLEMPNMKGNQAAKEMLKLKPEIDIVLVTSIVDKKELIGALNIGIKRILKKPISFDEFKKVMNEIKDNK